MRKVDIKVGMVVAVSSNVRNNAPIELRARKAMVVEVGVETGRRSFDKKANSTRLHWFENVPDPEDGGWIYDQFTDELREYDPEANAPYPSAGRELPHFEQEELPAYKTEQAAYRAAGRLREAQTVVTNRHLIMPWDEYVVERDKLRASIAELEERSANMKATEEARRATLLNQLIELVGEDVFEYKYDHGIYQLQIKGYYKEHEAFVKLLGEKLS